MSARKPQVRVQPLALTSQQACEAIGNVSLHFFEEHIAHELKWIRRGRRKFVSVRELERWLSENEERIWGDTAG